MTGPCLCGDPACGRCFPSGQTRVHCTGIGVGCDWKGQRYECGTEELSYGITDTCPECGDDCEEDE